LPLGGGAREASRERNADKMEFTKREVVAVF
jgi:hypothetical protein